MGTLVLFGTEGCHLCEEAEQVLSQAKIEFAKRDILEQDDWHQRYATSIPVLLNTRTDQTLNWPFTVQQINEFLEVD